MEIQIVTLIAVLLWNAVFCLAIDLAYTACGGFFHFEPVHIKYRLQAYSAWLLFVVLQNVPL